MLRKFVSLFLILVLLLSTASATSEPIPDEIVYTNGVTINHILNHTAFDKIFNTNSQGSSYSSNDEYGNINLYLSMVSAPNSMYETTLDFEVNIGGDTHLISTHGTSYELIPYENGSILFGDLVGHTFINGTECDVNVGMLKATDSETVSVAVTIIPQNARDWNDVVRFDFGGTVITPEMVSNMNTKQSNNHGGKNSIKVLDDAQEVPNWDKTSSILVGFESYDGPDAPSYSQKLQLAYADNADRLAAGVTTFCDEINSSFDGTLAGTQHVGTSVSTVDFSISRNDSMPTISVDSISKNTTGDDVTFVSKLFDLVTGAFEIESSVASILKTIISNAGNKFTVTLDDSTDASKEVHFWANPLAGITFDDTPIAVAFNLHSVQPGKYSFAISSDVTYTSTVSDSFSYIVYTYRSNTAALSHQRFDIG